MARLLAILLASLLAPSCGFLVPQATAGLAREPPAQRAANARGSESFGVGGVLFVVCAGVVARDVRMRAASPKGKPGRSGTGINENL